MANKLISYGACYRSYGFARVEHAFFGKNKPAIFKYPFWSLIADFTLVFEMLFGSRSLDAAKD